MKTSYYYAYCQGDILLTSEGNVPFGDTPPFDLKPWQQVTTIETDDRRCVVVRLDEPIVGCGGLRMVPLRKTFSLLSPKDYQLAGKCAELVYWDHNSKYCGCCGAPMKWHTPISKHCSECGKEIWPSLATAIIVRVTRCLTNVSSDEEILLVHANNFRGNHYGLVAGFVETGETLEECVQREVWEETHIRVTNIRYFGSQPWPFPCGLMVGFTADYVGGDIRLQREELGSGGWYRRDSLPPIPDKASIARQLIDDWLVKGNEALGL